NRQCPIDRGEGALKVARGFAHRRKLVPQGEARPTVLHRLLEQRFGHAVLAASGRPIGLIFESLSLRHCCHHYERRPKCKGFRTACAPHDAGNLSLIHCEKTHFSPDVGGSPACNVWRSGFPSRLTLAKNKPSPVFGRYL